MASAYQTWVLLYPLLALALSFFLVACRWERTPWARRWGEAVLFRISRRGLDALELWHLVLFVGAAFVVVTAVNDLGGAWGCVPGTVDDPVGLLNSGRAFLEGQDPFFVQVCGAGDPIPYGIAAVVLDGLGSIFGVLGVWAMWGSVSLTLVILVWEIAGEDRRYVTLLVATSSLYIPAVMGQIDAASNTLVPVTLLLSLLFLRSRRTWIAAVGGLLATARFPVIFPLMGSTGRLGRDRFLAPGLALGAFAVGTAVAYLRWGSSFVTTVFLNEVTRTSGSENAFGVLLAHGWYPSGYLMPAVQGLVTLLIVEEVWRRKFAPVAGGVVILVGIALITQFLSFSSLVWLLPLVLLGATAQRGLWWVSLVGTLNYDYAFNILLLRDGVAWPSELLDGLMTVVLLALFVLLFRAAENEATQADAPPRKAERVARAAEPSELLVEGSPEQV